MISTMLSLLPEEGKGREGTERKGIERKGIERKPGYSLSTFLYFSAFYWTAQAINAERKDC